MQQCTTRSPSSELTAPRPVNATQTAADSKQVARRPKRVRDADDHAYRNRCVKQRQVERLAAQKDDAFKHLARALGSGDNVQAFKCGLEACNSPPETDIELFRQWRSGYSKNQPVAVEFIRAYFKLRGANETFRSLVAASGASPGEFEDICNIAIGMIYRKGGAAGRDSVRKIVALLGVQHVSNSSDQHSALLQAAGFGAHPSPPTDASFQDERLRQLSRCIAARLVDATINADQVRWILEATTGHDSFPAGAHRIFFEELVRRLPCPRLDEAFQMKLPPCAPSSHPPMHLDQTVWPHLWFRLALQLEQQCQREEIDTPRPVSSKSMHEFGVALVKVFKADPMSDELLWQRMAYLLKPIVDTHDGLNGTATRSVFDLVARTRHDVCSMLDGFVCSKGQARPDFATDKPACHDRKSSPGAGEISSSMSDGLKAFIGGLRPRTHNAAETVAAAVLSSFFRSVASVKEMHELLSAVVAENPDRPGWGPERVRVVSALWSLGGTVKFSDPHRVAWVISALGAMDGRDAETALNGLMRDALTVNSSNEVIAQTCRAVLATSKSAALLQEALVSNCALDSSKVKVVLRAWPQLTTDERVKLTEELVSGAKHVIAGASGRKSLLATPVLIRAIATPDSTSDPLGAVERVTTFKAVCEKAEITAVQSTRDEVEFQSVDEFIRGGLSQIDDDATRDSVSFLFDGTPSAAKPAS